jgi:hypothetical protein
MHPVFLSFAIYAAVVMIGALALAVRHMRSPRRSMRLQPRMEIHGPAQRSVRLQPWMDLDGSARRQRRRVTALH